MRKPSAAFFITFTLAQAALAEWQLVSMRSEPSTVPGIECRHVDMRDFPGGGAATIDLAVFSGHAANLRVIDNARGADNLAEAMAREKCVAGVNGGYFDTNFKPIGLRVIDGATTSPLLRAPLLTGLLSAGTGGIEIIRRGEFSRRTKVDQAIQCGPFLIDLGMRTRALDDRRSARRTFAAAARGGRSALGVASKMTLAQLADALSNHSLTKDFQIWRAMNLDGGSSSAFWFKRKDGTIFSIPEQKSVRDFIAVTK